MNDVSHEYLVLIYRTFYAINMRTNKINDLRMISMLFRVRSSSTKEDYYTPPE